MAQRICGARRAQANGRADHTRAEQHGFAFHLPGMEHTPSEEPAIDQTPTDLSPVDPRPPQPFFFNPDAERAERLVAARQERTSGV